MYSYTGATLGPLQCRHSVSPVYTLATLDFGLGMPKVNSVRNSLSFFFVCDLVVVCENGLRSTLHVYPIRPLQVYSLLLARWRVGFGLSMKKKHEICIIKFNLENNRIYEFDFFGPSFFFCWRVGKFLVKRLTRNKELICDGLIYF